MIKGLIVMNPRVGPKSRRLKLRKTKTTMKVARRRRSVLRHRKVRRNPPHSAAMRRKIGLAVRRANARRKSGGARRTVVRTKVVRRTRTRSVPVFRTRTRTLVKRIRSRRRSGGGGGRKLSLGGIISKDNLMLAGGVIGANLLSRVVIGKFGTMLPGAATPMGNAAYTLGISVGGAYLVRRFSPKLAEGLIIGGLVAVVNQVVAMALPAAAVGEYLGAGYDPTMSLGPATQQMAQINAPAPSVDAYLDSQPAFDNSAW